MAQKKKAAKSALIELLSEHVGVGNKVALRDLAKIWDKNPDNQLVKNILKQHTLFSKEEWDWEQKASNATFTAFFYEKESQLSFSELLRVFYISPVEKHLQAVAIFPQTNPSVDPLFIRKLIQNIHKQIDKKNIKALNEAINQLGLVKSKIVPSLLDNISKNKKLNSWSIKQKEKVLARILYHLPDSMAYAQVLNLTKEKQASFAFCQQQLALLSNNYYPAENRADLYQFYQKLNASYQNNLANIKTYGYNQIKLTPIEFFKEEVDYYGWILANCRDSLFWIQHNALKDMIRTQHPKSLFYLAGLQYRTWKKGAINNQYYSEIIAQNIDVFLQNKSNLAAILPNTASNQHLAFIAYWANHYDDYEWDEIQETFYNKQLFSKELDNYDRYFRRLNSRNDSVALNAYSALIEGKPSEIKKLIDKFKPLLRNYNKALPPLKFKVLKQFSVLAHFCKTNNFQYKPSPSLAANLARLKTISSPQERIKLENQLIKTLRINDLTALEYYASLNAQHLTLNFSIGRVLDYLYTKYWQQITSQEPQFRLFLLKLQLFEQLGGFGVCKRYAQKVNLEDSYMLNRLRQLNILETKTEIKQSIAQLLEQKERLASSQQLEEFLSKPATLSAEDLKKLPPFSVEKLPEIVQILFQQENKKAINNIGKYIELYASVNMTPQLFETPQKRWASNKYAGKAIIKVLEKIYNFSFSTKQLESIVKWWELWRSNPKDYTNWSQLLFEQQLKKIQVARVLTIEDLNKITQSSFYEKKHRVICLEALKKVKRLRTIYRLKIAPKLSIESELHYLENIPFGHKELGNLPKIFKIEKADLLLDFIHKKTQSLASTQLSTLYNNLFRQSWFKDYVSSGQIKTAERDYIKTLFEKYLAESTFLTEFEEKNTQINILYLEHAYQSLKEKLQVIAQDSLQKEIHIDYLKDILSRIAFHEIIIAFPVLQELHATAPTLFDFLNRDFGLPIFDFEDNQQLELLHNQLKTHTEFQFYQQQLLQFGLPILKKNKTLDFKKVYELLTFDLVVPFIGEGGKFRDYYAYGLVKLLELHFKTTLGFSDKLNENQTFYTYTSLKRVNAWKAFLIEKGLIMEVANRSFN